MHLNTLWLKWYFHSCLTGTFVPWVKVSLFLCQTVHLPRAPRDRFCSRLGKGKAKLLLLEYMWRPVFIAVALKKTLEF